MLAGALDTYNFPEPRLDAACRHAVLGGGKRLRPTLVFQTAACLGEITALTDAAAVAVELVHCYSLVHDDLPAMDNDDLRRGRPTVHKAYDEATAILVGDALQAMAFATLAERQPAAPAGNQVRMVAELARASGPEGMVGGQALDLQATGQQLSDVELEQMHGLKTGALIRASILLGALSTRRVEESLRQALESFARALGLAFQIQDDILDVSGETHVLGKQQGSDAKLDKPTYVSILGLAGARLARENAHQAAVAALRQLPGDASGLLALTDHVVARST